MFYVIQTLTSELVFIKWYRMPKPGRSPASEFIAELQTQLDQAKQPLYFLSDLRGGLITDVRVLMQLGKLTQHPQYGGGVAFSHDVLSDIFVGVFTKFAGPAKGDDVLYEQLQQALDDLERRKPGIAQGIDWAAVLAQVAAL